MTKVRGIRGATTVEENSKEAILSATEELLRQMVQANEVVTDDVACAFFTTTRDLNAEFPAAAARIRLGWANTALLNSHEMDVPDGLERCIRVLLLVNTGKSAAEVHHVYLRRAENLRSRGLDETP